MLESLTWCQVVRDRRSCLKDERCGSYRATTCTSVVRWHWLRAAAFLARRWAALLVPSKAQAAARQHGEARCGGRACDFLSSRVGLGHVEASAQLITGAVQAASWGAEVRFEPARGSTGAEGASQQLPTCTGQKPLSADLDMLSILQPRPAAGSFDAELFNCSTSRVAEADDCVFLISRFANL